jgi:succinate dehydrogenase/fumarate reductase flavoprotein subunit
MGGVTADERMATEVPGLLAAGETIGGANGANRLSGNAITEALVFGRRAGLSAAERANQIAGQPFRPQAARQALDLATAEPRPSTVNTAGMIERLQTVMANDVGPFRTAERLAHALETIEEITQELGEHPMGDGGAFDLRRLEWFDLRNMLLAARAVAVAALARTESRGAHQREDFPDMEPRWQLNQMVRLTDRGLRLMTVPSATQAAAQ